jgi:hypothetical protein
VLKIPRGPIQLGKVELAGPWLVSAHMLQIMAEDGLMFFLLAGQH